MTAAARNFAATFAAAARFPNVQLLRHAVNLGKGAALKTAFNYVLCAMPDAAGVVTADADGQHAPEDIARVAEALAAQPDALVLGARAFGADVPLRSRFGNIVTRGIMHALLGRKLADTQTGLRGIPAAPAAADAAHRSHRLRIRAGDADRRAPALHSRGGAAHPHHLRARQQVVALQPHRRFDEDLLRPAALRLGFAGQRGCWTTWSSS